MNGDLHPAPSVDRIACGAVWHREHYAELRRAQFGASARIGFREPRRRQPRRTGLAGASAWVLPTFVPRDGQHQSDRVGARLSIAGGVPILGLDMYEHAFHPK